MTLSETTKEGETHRSTKEKKDSRKDNKFDNTTGRNKSKDFYERRKTLKVPGEVEKKTQNRTFQHNERQFFKLICGMGTETNQLVKSKETKQLWRDTWKPKEKTYQKCQMDKVNEKELELEEGPDANIHQDMIRATVKKIQNWKRPSHDGIHGFRFKKKKSCQSTTALQLIKCQEERRYPLE